MMTFFIPIWPAPSHECALPSVPRRNTPAAASHVQSKPTDVEVLPMRNDALDTGAMPVPANCSPFFRYSKSGGGALVFLGVNSRNVSVFVYMLCSNGRSLRRL